MLIYLMYINVNGNHINRVLENAIADGKCINGNALYFVTIADIG